MIHIENIHIRGLLYLINYKHTISIILNEKYTYTHDIICTKNIHIPEVLYQIFFWIYLGYHKYLLTDVMNIPRNIMSM